jgi:repressor LexA
MRTKDQGALDKILKFVNKYYQENRVAPTISEVAAGVGVARSTTHRYIQELSDRDLLDYGRGILSAPESAKMKTAYIAAPLVGSIYCGSPEEEEENVEEYVSLPVSLFGKGDFYILRAKGDSMVDAGIAEGDLLVIERNCPASEGDKRRGDHRDHTGCLHTGVEVGSCSNWEWYESRGRGRSCYPASV